MPAPLPPPAGPAAGWYPDGGPTGSLRWWDGAGWTGHVAVPTPPPLERRSTPHPTLPLTDAIGALAVLGASLIAGRALLDALVPYRWPIIAYVALTATVAYGPALVWCLVTTRRSSDAPWHARLGIEAHRSDPGWALVTWMGAVAAEIVVASVILAVGIPTSSNTEGIDEISADRTYVVSLLVLAVVAAPIVEEVVFRAVVLRGFLSRLPVAGAIGAQAVLFGMAHVDPARGVGNVGLVMITGAIGAAFGVSAYLLRRIEVTILAHAILNGVVMAIVLSGVFDDVGN